MISTGYPLPFRFVYTAGVFASDRQSYLHIRYASPRGAADLTAAVEAFATLAASGALCGAGVDPAHSTLRLRQQTPPAGNELLWTVERALLCEEALVVLAHLLLATVERSDIELVEVLTHATELAPQTLACSAQFNSTYPPVHGSPAFDIDDDGLEADAYSFDIELAQPLEARGEAWLNAMLAAWARVVELGGYASAPVPPAQSYLESDETITAYDRSIEWALFKLRADEACIDSILNGLMAFDRRCQRIARVSVV